MNDLISVQQAANICKTSWSDAYSNLRNGLWTPVKCGPASLCIRVRKSEVEATARYG